MQVIIDRFENDIAICECEDKSIINIPLAKIIGNPKEGDILELTKDNMYIINDKKTKDRKKEITNLFNSL